MTSRTSAKATPVNARDKAMKAKHRVDVDVAATTESPDFSPTHQISSLGVSWFVTYRRAPCTRYTAERAELWRLWDRVIFEFRSGHQVRRAERPLSARSGHSWRPHKRCTADRSRTTPCG